MYNILKEDYVRCVWPGESLPLGEDGHFLINFFKDNYDVDIEYLEQIKTLPGHGPKGGRIDQVFNVYLDSIDNLEKVKDKLGVVYAKDYVREGNHRLFNERIFQNFFKRFQDELLKDGELAEENVFKSLWDR